MANLELPLSRFFWPMRFKLPKLVFSGNAQSVLVVRLLVVLVIHAISRILLYTFNPGLFPGMDSLSWLSCFFKGMRFDGVAVLYGNLLYIIMLLLPFRFRRKRGFSRATNLLFYITNAVLLLPNFIDLIYYRFTLKRLTSDIFKYIGTGTDTADMLPTFLHDFWYILVLWAVSVAALVWICSCVRIAKRYVMQSNLSYFLMQSLTMLLFGGLVVLGLRGGTQLKPLSIIDASAMAPPQQAPLLLNSAFTILRSPSAVKLNDFNVFEKNQNPLSIFNARKDYSQPDTSLHRPFASPPNLVIIILESFSAEHIGALNGKTPPETFTPFLDSLLGAGPCLRAFANGKRSIEGIPAILSSMPSWMDEDFITSQFASDRYTSLAGLLKKLHYTSAFFHGGKNGTMGFESYAMASGFDHYYGKDQYPVPADFDGHWGIWDEPYLQYMAGELTKIDTPFLATVFTLSSHHPYQIPPQYEGKFPTGKLPIQRTIAYTDYALRQFFRKAATLPWYKNTLFVITADHTSESTGGYFASAHGQYAIPLLFFAPGHSFNLDTSYTAQQTDIMPTVLDMMAYPEPFVAFGNSLLRKNEPHFSLTYLQNRYQLIMGNVCWQGDILLNTIALYKVSSDSLLRNNLALEQVEKSNRMRLITGSIMQQYAFRLKHNQLIIK